ncbi:hypothetical protein [Halorubrum sp. SP9]|uniref:hypothetical protein n=1 Tax=Halorubrum sp. SP9 TaxID=1537267 RepID=UPI0010F95131|nr:hypothetical protein [Halorubrum sp. SP9]TKX68239.1 hypothetical protein EXE45_12250 [Halorubrum sp. SP9]
MEPVEDGWKAELIDYGIDEAQAETIVSMLQSSTDLVLGSQSEDDVEETLRRAIEETDFEEYGAEKPQRLTNALLRVLDEWQDGSRAPPVAAAPRRGPTDWEDGNEAPIEDENRTDDSNGGDDANSDDDAIPQEGSDETIDETEDGESVTTIQGDPISPDTEVDPQAAPGQEGIAGGAGPITDEQGIVKEAANATQEPQDTGLQASESQGSGSSPAQAPETDAGSGEDQRESQADRSTETADDNSDGGERQQDIDIPKTIAHIQFNRNEEIINSWTEQPAELVEDEITSYATSVAQVYRDLVKEAMFPGMSDTEQELLFEKLVEDRIEERMNSE